MWGGSGGPMGGPSAPLHSPATATPHTARGSRRRSERRASGFSHVWRPMGRIFSLFFGAPESEAGPSGREREGPSPVLALGVLADCARACSCCRLLAHLFNIRSIDIEPPQIPTPNRPPKQKAKGMWWACGMWGCRASALLSSAVQRERRTRERAVHTPHYLNLPSVFCRRF